MEEPTPSPTSSVSSAASATAFAKPTPPLELRLSSMPSYESSRLLDSPDVHTTMSVWRRVPLLRAINYAKRTY